MDYDDQKILKYARGIKFLRYDMNLSIDGSKLPSDDDEMLEFTKRTVIGLTESKRVDTSALEVFYECHTEHSFNFQGFFKPSIAEILTQLSDDVLKCADAISVDLAFGGDLEKCFTAGNKRHIGVVKVYTGELKELSKADLLARLREERAKEVVSLG